MKAPDVEAGGRAFGRAGGLTGPAREATRRP